MKSAFATKETRTYKYPDPLNITEVDGEKVPEAVLDARKQLIDPELEGEDIWVKFRIPHSKADLDAIADLTQSLTLVDAEGAHITQRVSYGNRGVFELLVESWSFEREPNGAAYQELTNWAGDWVTNAMNDAMRRGTQRDYAKKMSPSSPEPENSEPSSSGLPLEEPVSG